MADQLLRALVAAGPAGLDRRALDRTLGGHVTSAQVKVALDQLRQRERIFTFSEETGGRPRQVAVASVHADKAEKTEEG